MNSKIRKTRLKYNFRFCIWSLTNSFLDLWFLKKKIAFHYCAKKNLKDEIKKKNRDQNSRKKYVKDQIQNLKKFQGQKTL